MSAIERTTLSSMDIRGQLSVFYDMLRSKSKDNSHSRLNAWRDDLKVDITENEWENACLKAQKQTINTALKLIQYKWLFRTYVTPVKQYNPNIPDNCTKCNDNVGTLLHCVWECQKIQLFWKDIVNPVSQIAVIEIPLEVKLCILGIYPDHFAPGRKAAPLMCLLQARRVIALRWKNMDSPTPAMWLQEMASCLALEKLAHVVRGKLNKFREIWDTFMQFLESDQTEINE